MIKRSQEYNSAWEFYKTLKTIADDRTLSLHQVPDWSGLWECKGGPSRFDRDWVDNKTTASLKGKHADIVGKLRRDTSGIPILVAVCRSNTHACLRMDVHTSLR